MAEEDFPWRHEASRDSSDTDTNYARSYETALLYRIRRSTGWMAFFTLVTATGAGVGAYLFWQQLNAVEELSDQIQREAAVSRRVMEKLSESIDQSVQGETVASRKLSELIDQRIPGESAASRKLFEVIDQSVDATNKQTAAVQNLAEIATNGQLASNRPWMGIESVVPTGTLAVNRPYGLKVVMRNGGRSPALAVRSVLHTAVHGTDDIALPNVDECHNCAQQTVLPNGTLGYDVTVDADALTKDVIGHLKNSVSTILLFGRIDYSDSTAKTHATSVCMKYEPTSASFSSCTQGNNFN